jgi:uncharacterized protein
LLSRRRFLGVAGAAVLAGGTTTVYARRWEPEWLEVRRTQIRTQPSGVAAASIRILHLSDLHASPVVPMGLITEAIARGLAEQPDLVALTGDFVTGRNADWDALREALSVLPVVVPTFACLGNHDGGVWTQRGGRGYTSQRLQQVLAETGIELLHNRSRQITLRGRPVQITGVGDLWAGECQPAIAFFDQQPLPDEALRLVLNHNPDAKDLFNDYPWDLMLCGHTHGGQLRLPLIGTPFAPVADKRFVEGLHPWDGRQIYITRGVGNLHGVRFNCRPEVTLLDVT